MKIKTPLIACILAFVCNQGALAESSVFQPLSDTPQSDEEEFFKVVNGEAKIDGQVIKLIVVKPEHLTASYKNDSNKDVFPKYVMKIFNQYGYLLGSHTVGGSFFGGSSKLEPGDVGGEKIRIDLVDLKGVFQQTRLDLPKGFFKASWLSLSKSNTQLGEQEDVDQPATVSEPEAEGKENSKPEPEAPSQ